MTTPACAGLFSVSSPFSVGTLLAVSPSMLYFLLACFSAPSTKDSVFTGPLTETSTDLDGDGFYAPEDCNDNNPNIHPDAHESCNGQDDDCNGEVDEGLLHDWFPDVDQDGFGHDEAPLSLCEAPEGYVSNTEDCDDLDATRYPNAPERCDGQDNDCDAFVDDADVDQVGGRTFFEDTDGDGFGGGASQRYCFPPEGWTETDGDCDDTRAEVHPNATEICDPNDVDEDCNGRANDDDGRVDPDTLQTAYADRDGDGFGDFEAPLMVCNLPNGWVWDALDCDDFNGAIHPGATEICDPNAQDEDCNGLSNDADPSVDSSTQLTGYADTDGDGYGDSATVTMACVLPSNFVGDASDCDDLQATVHPGATEICDTHAQDEDCNGLADDQDPGVDSSTQLTGYADTDGDGYGDSATATTACVLPSDLIGDASDCDDQQATVHPGATEICDDQDVDENCNLLADDADPNVDVQGVVWYQDTDGDGYGSTPYPVMVCDPPVGYGGEGNDCNDNDAAISPAALEANDGIDNDCDGLLDCLDNGVFVSETPYDGIDNDCDATTTDDDLDGDGVVEASDCNDLDTGVGLPDIWNGSVNVNNLTQVCASSTCTEVHGDVQITYSTLRDLSALSCVRSIQGMLRVGDNNQLTSLTGLEALEEVSGSLQIGAYAGRARGNPALTDLNGLQNLSNIGGNLVIWSNNALTDLTGLENLSNIGGNLFIYRNNALTHLTGLQNLSNIGGGLDIFNNAALTHLTGLQNLSDIGGNLFIRENDALTHLTGLENLSNIGGDLFIYRNNALTHLTGLQNLSNIPARLYIAYNDALTDLTGLQNLSDIGGGLYIGNNDALTDLTGLQNLSDIGGYLSIGVNDALTDLTGLENLTSIGGELDIDYNHALTDISSLYALTLVAGNLTIRDNLTLPTQMAWDLRNEIDVIGGSINIYGNQ